MINNKKDFNLIASLIEDARIPLTKLAKKTRLSREVVQYRLKNLESSLIMSYQARINLSAISQGVYTLYLQIQGLEREKVINKLKSLPATHWIGSSGGKWNFIVSFSVNKENTLDDYLNDLGDKLDNYIKNYLLTTHLEEFKDTFSNLFDKRENHVSKKPLKKIPPLDEIDFKIISRLTKNARISNAQIAEEINSTRETVRQRIKILENNKIILNYRTIIRPESLNLETYFLAIKSLNLNATKIKPLCHYLTELKECSYVSRTAGEVNIISVISTGSLKELDKIITDLQKKFPNIINEIESLPLFELGAQTYSSKK